MTLLSEGDRRQVRDMLSRMTGPVRLVFFTQAIGCDECATTKRILEEVAPLSELITVDERNFVLERDAAAEYGVDLVPAIAVVGAADHGIRFFGVPAGYEFMSLLEAIVMVSTGESGLSEESRALLAAVSRPVAIQVFTTPT